jgi:hypothetical protein
MARKGRNVLITLGVVLGIFIIAVVAVRVFLTREKLLAIVIPRVEKAVDAKVSIADIGISFPFGLGVDIDGLSFQKTLPDTSALVFSSKKVTVRSSLMSLIKRKPEIKAADVQGGTVTVLNEKKRREIKLLGLNAHVSMKPAGEKFSVSAKALVDSVLVSVPGRPPAVTLEKVGFDGALESDRDFTTLTIKDSKVSWNDLAAAKIKGEIVNVKTAPRVTLTVESVEEPLAPILERVKSFKLDELAPAKPRAPGPSTPEAPVAVSGGTFGFNAHVEGLVRQPLAINLSFECSLKDLAVKAGDLVSIAKLSAAFKGQGVALAWLSLFPSPERPMTPAQISLAWSAVKIDGTVELEGGDVVMQGGPPQGSSAVAPPVHISSLKARAEISGPDVKKLSGGFNIGASPYTFNGSMINIMPAAAELALVAQGLQAAGQKAIPDLGTLLDRMANAPVVTFDIAGRSFDARAYEQPVAGAAPEGAKAAGASVPAPTPPAATGPGAILFLKNTTFTAKLDSIIMREAVITGLAAKGTIRDGRVKIDPVTFAYAGGTGASTVNADLRKSERVESKVDLSMDGVEAAQALSRFGAAAGLIQGKFSFKSNASLATGPGVAPLTALSATGSALSSKGIVSFESFLAPLSNIKGFDVTPFKSFDYNEWRGSFVVKNGRFICDDWKFNSSRGAWSIKGSFGFDGTLDYAVHVVIPPAVQSMMQGLDQYKGALDLMRDKSGNLVLDVKIGGTTKHPTASLDITQAQNRMQDKLLEGLKKKFLK